MARVRVRLFAGPRDVVGRGEVAIEVPDRSTLGDAVDRLVAAYPDLARYRGHSLLSLNREFADPGRPVADGDEIGFLPPVSGGAGDARIGADRIAIDEALAAAQRDGAGAAVAFVGLVRDTSGERPGAPVERLEFESYAEMAQREAEALRRRAIEKFGLKDATIHHRLGALGVGEPIVLVLATAAHRQAAFEAASWMMDELKASVPVWKREVAPTGDARWVRDPTEGVT